jgi:hypothetical protein
VLKRIEAEERQLGYFFARCPDAKYTALVLRSFVVGSYRNV